MLELKKGLNLESLRQPFKTALITASQIGADGVEINARSQLRPGELSRTGVRHLRKMLGDLGLKVSAIHFPTRRGFDELEDLDRRIDATKNAMDMAYQLGCNVVTNRIGQLIKDDDSSRRVNMIQALTDLGRHSQKSGAWLAAKTGTEDGATLKQLIDSLPAMSIGVDFDAGQMLIGGYSATESLAALAEHVIAFRARDAVRDLSVGKTVEVQLGRGSIDLPSMLAILEQKNYSGYITVERDAESDAVMQCAQSLEFLNNLFQ